MKIATNTCFMPTVNGPLHPGHAYMAMVNAHEAHANGGKFYLLFDDTQAYWSDRLAWAGVAQCKRSMVEDLLWLNVKVDGVYSASEMTYEAGKLLATRCHEAGLPVPDNKYADEHFPEVVGDTTQPYPYTAFKTAEKVIMHGMLGVTLRVAGVDLLDEFALYNYFCETLKMHTPRHVYLPRMRVLTGKYGDGSVEFDVTKTSGAYQLQDFRAAGTSAADMLAELEAGCLQDAEKGWAIDNLRSHPVLRVPTQ